MDKTWLLTIKVKVTTMSGWEPDKEYIVQWLDDGGTLQLIDVESSEELT